MTGFVLNRENRKIGSEVLAGKIVDFLGTEAACKVWGVTGSTLSRYRSSPVEGHDNHKPSPFEKVIWTVKEIRFEIEERNEESRKEGQLLLKTIGNFFARYCKGVFISFEDLEKCQELLMEMGLIKEDNVEES
ncbi:MAG: hypothetical protein JXI43_11690 [Tissierellales bacterium]|nr:hypothetical protein [Tissierellales bacterium]